MNDERCSRSSDSTRGDGPMRVINVAIGEVACDRGWIISQYRLTREGIEVRHDLGTALLTWEELMDQRSLMMSNVSNVGSDYRFAAKVETASAIRWTSNILVEVLSNNHQFLPDEVGDLLQGVISDLHKISKLM